MGQSKEDISTIDSQIYILVTSTCIIANQELIPTYTYEWVNRFCTEHSFPSL